MLAAAAAAPDFQNSRGAVRARWGRPMLLYVLYRKDKLRNMPHAGPCSPAQQPAASAEKWSDCWPPAAAEQQPALTWPAVLELPTPVCVVHAAVLTNVPE